MTVETVIAIGAATTIAGFAFGVFLGHGGSSSTLPTIVDHWRRDREDARRHALKMAEEQTKQLRA